MKGNLSRNLKYLRKQSGKSQTDIGLQLNKAHTSIGNWEKGISEPSLEEIEQIARIFEISPADLLFKDLEHVHLNENEGKGKNVHLNVHPTVHLNHDKAASEVNITPAEEGEKQGLKRGSRGAQNMPKVITLDSSGEENAVFVPVRARAGYLLGYGDPDYIEKLPAYSLPGLRNGTYRIFEVDGLSMFNTLQDKDRVIGRWVPVSEIREDRVHVLITRNDGLVIKRCLNRVQEGKIVCKSDNNHKGEYPNIVLETNEIMEAWYVVERWTRQLPNPGEIYKRIIDLEADMAIIKQRIAKGE